MFAVLIEAEPRKEQWGAYLAKTDMLLPELGRASGFVDHVRYRSLTRKGWILSLSDWRDEASVVGWQTGMPDDEARERGLSELLAGHCTRVGEVTSDTRLPDGQAIEARQNEPEIGHVTLIDAKQTPEWVAANNAEEMALYLGFDLYSYGDCISWDILDSLSNPGEIILIVNWKDARSANDHAATQIVPDDARVRVIRVVRDDWIFDRRETTQSDPDAARREAIGA